MHLSRIRLEHLDHRIPYIDSSFCINTFLPDTCDSFAPPGSPGHRCRVLTQDRIKLPTPEPLASLDHDGPILDRSRIENHRALAVYSLAIMLASLVKALVQLPASGLVSSHIPTDPLMADGHINPVAHTADLFRAPLSRQRQLNEVDRVWWHPVPGRAAPSLLCQSMSLCRIILSFLPVTSQLPINRVSVNIDDSGDF